VPKVLHEEVGGVPIHSWSVWRHPPARQSGSPAPAAFLALDTSFWGRLS
jgi:hypothetical protein